ncbi:hypothetical protein BGZ80_007342, partial [Entomortierella chlamydospora]
KKKGCTHTRYRWGAFQPLQKLKVMPWFPFLSAPAAAAAVMESKVMNGKGSNGDQAS